MVDELQTYLVRCWKITCYNGQVFCFTDHNKDLKINDEIYSSVSPINMTTVEKNIGLDIDNLEISGVFNHANIRKSEIESGLFNEAKISIFEYDWNKNVKMNVIFEGVFSSYTYGKDRYSVETQSVFGKLGHVFGRGFHLTCDAELGDQNCGVNINEPGYKFTPNIINFDDYGLEISRIPGISDGRFRNGTVEFIANKQIEFRLSIKSDKAIGNIRRITFWNRLKPIQKNFDSINLYIGCDKSIDCCSNKFNNAINFRGFPNIPSDDWIVVQQEN